MDRLDALTALNLRHADEKGRPITYDDRAIRIAYLRQLASAHPQMGADAVGGADPWDETVRVMEAFRVLLDLDSPHPLDRDTDPVPYLLDVAMVHGLGKVVLPLLPAFIPATRIQHLERLGLDEAWRDALDALGDVPDLWAEEATDLRNWLADLSTPVDVLFRATAWTSKGQTVLGTASKISAKDRALLPGPMSQRPTHRVTLSLPAWLERGPEARARLLMHELWHFDPARTVDREWRVKMRGHDIEEHGVVLHRYGTEGAAQVVAVVAGAAHEKTPERVREHVTDEIGQALLFEVVRR